eukprot:gene19062-6385_t
MRLAEAQVNIDRWMDERQVLIAKLEGQEPLADDEGSDPPAKMNADDPFHHEKGVYGSSFADSEPAQPPEDKPATDQPPEDKPATAQPPTQTGPPPLLEQFVLPGKNQKGPVILEMCEPSPKPVASLKTEHTQQKPRSMSPPRQKKPWDPGYVNEKGQSMVEVIQELEIQKVQE